MNVVKDNVLQMEASGITIAVPEIKDIDVVSLFHNFIIHNVVSDFKQHLFNLYLILMNEIHVKLI